MGYLTSSPYPARPTVREAEADYESAVPDPVPPSGEAAREAEAPDIEALDHLGHEIALLSAHIESATQRLLDLIVQFDEGRGWELAGFRSCAEWLAHRTGIDKGAARERVRAARALRELPLTREAMARGELTFSKVRALTRVAEPDNEAHLLELARESTASALERMVRGWKMANARDEADRDALRHRSRCLSVFPDLDGTYVVRGRLTPEVGALLMRAIEAASDVLYSAEQTELEEVKGARRSRERPSAEDSEAAASRRRADALALLVEQAMAAGLGGAAPGSLAPSGYDNALSNVSAETRSARRSPTPDRAAPTLSGTSAERYQVLVHVDLETLSAPEVHPLAQAAGRHRKRARKTRLDRIVEAAREVGMVRGCEEVEGAQPPCGAGDHSHIDDVRVGAETSRRLCCDASVVRVAHGTAGSPLNLGRRTRTISPALRRALELRDRGCRFPGCGSRFTDAHHIRHWADGGETSLTNCILLCRHHHRLVHEGGWSVVSWGEGRPIFSDPRGGMHFDGRWTPPKLGDDPVAVLVAGNPRLGPPE